MNKKKFILLVVVALIITILPLSFISCKKTDDIDAFWTLQELVMDSGNYADSAIELTEFENKKITVIDSIDYFDKVLLKEEFVDQGENKYKYMVYDIANLKIVYEKIVSLTESYDLTTQNYVILEETMVDSKYVYNYYSPSMDLITTEDMVLTVSSLRDDATFNIGKEKYKLFRSGKVEKAGLDTCSAEINGFKYYSTTSFFSVSNKDGKTIYSSEINDLIKIYKICGDRLLRQEVIEVPITEKDYTYIKDGKKYLVEQTVVTLKKNKAKEKKVKDVEFVYTAAYSLDMQYGTDIEADLAEIKNCSENIFVGIGCEVYKQNLKEETYRVFNKDLEMILKNLTDVSIKGTSGDNLLVEDANGDFFIYDKQGNLKHALNNYTVVKLANGLMRVDGQLYDYNLKKVEEHEDISILSNSSVYAYAVMNEQEDPADPQTRTIYRYNDSTKKMEKLYENVVDLSSKYIARIAGDGTYQYSIIKNDKYDELKIPDKVKATLSLTKEQYESYADKISISRHNISRYNYVSGSFIKITKTVSGQTTYTYLLAK